jgi:hypothetical protein
MGERATYVACERDQDHQPNHHGPMPAFTLLPSAQEIQYDGQRGYCDAQPLMLIDELFIIIITTRQEIAGYTRYDRTDHTEEERYIDRLFQSGGGLPALEELEYTCKHQYTDRQVYEYGMEMTN